MNLRARLAPSPTGVLHLGNARSFLLAWLDARASGAEVLLRIEDLDGPRLKSGAAQSAIADLTWLGLDWDIGPVFQKPRLARYREILNALRDKGWAYPCVCTRKDVETAASAPHVGEEGPIYPGTCRGRFPDEEQARRPSGLRPSWRFGVPEQEDVSFADRFCGRQTWSVGEDLGDFVVWKRDQEPAYQLAVVVDDHDQGINQVVRGDDLLSSAARQIWIHKALGWPTPSYAHLPLVVGLDGRRLAKRHGDTTIRFFREQGWPAARLIGMLAFASGLLANSAECEPKELIEDFDLARVGSAPLEWDGRNLRPSS